MRLDAWCFRREFSMRFRRRQIALVLCLATIALVARGAAAQDAAQHEHMHMNMPMDNGWQFMQDGILFVEFNHQGGPRGANETVAPNWWMGMATRKTSRGQLTLTGMLSLDPATV